MSVHTARSLGALMALGALLLTSCGRSSVHGVGGDAGPKPADWWVPPEVRVRPDLGRRDGPRLRDGWRPDGRKPDYLVPKKDLWPPKPDLWVPKKDLWPPKPDLWVPKPDLLPPLGDGPCNATCATMCGLLINCNLYSGGYGKCQNECPGWSFTQQSCLKKVACAWPPSCPAAATCLPTVGKPDLAITAFTANVTGNVVDYSVTVCNQGQVSAGSYYVDVYYNRATPPTVNNFGDNFAQYASLAPGACQVTKLQRTGTPPGAYNSFAQVDADGIVNESNEWNNVAGPVKVTVGGTAGVDLVIKSMTATVSGSTLASVVYQINVCNSGTATAPATEVHVYYNRGTAPPAGLSGDSFTTVPSLAPGGCSMRYITRVGVPPGTYTSWAQVDPKGLIAESNETNNTFGPVPVVVGTTPGADLTIKIFSALVQGLTTVRYTVQVCNSGTGTAGPSQAHVYYNRGTAPVAGENGDQLIWFGTLAPAACSTQYLYRQNTPPGTYSSYAQVDPGNAVAETNESNNVTGPIAVAVAGQPQQANLTIPSFSASLSGSTVSYTGQICNTGTVTAYAFRLDIYYNRTTSPPLNLAGNWHLNIASLAAGACTSFSHQTPGPVGGFWTSWAQVDTMNTVSESNESNNVAGPRLIVAAGLDCTAACVFAVSCGFFTATQLPQCVSWCNGLSSTAKQCVAQATQQLSCSALQQCAPMPPPPPPPPPPSTACTTVCGFVITTCNFMPGLPLSSCLNLCASLSAQQLQCALDAANKKQCNQLPGCIF